ncbi:hypothetical protein R50073_07250 [Maricurvus nonylphenolicus]
MSPIPQEHIQKIIFQGINLTDDCLGVFDDKDMLVFCNENLARLFGLPIEKALNKYFDEIIRHCHAAPGGINIETDDIEQWIIDANQKRRSQCFRAFETDLKDGRWVLVTEQLVEDQHIFMYCSDITDKKKYEFEIKKKSEELFTLATTDSLTQTYTRRHFYQQAERELSRCHREDITCALLMIDLDYFKKINDQYGHAGGDKALEHFSKGIRQQLREHDLVGRLGGEEFAILLPGTDKSTSIQIAERLRSTTEENTVSYRGTSFNISVSIGIAISSNNCKTIDQIMCLADNNLYKAKANGRNQFYHSNA